MVGIPYIYGIPYISVLLLEFDFCQEITNKTNQIDSNLNFKYPLHPYGIKVLIMVAWLLPEAPKGLPITCLPEVAVSNKLQSRRNVILVAVFLQCFHFYYKIQMQSSNECFYFGWEYYTLEFFSRAEMLSCRIGVGNIAHHLPSRSRGLLVLGQYEIS